MYCSGSESRAPIYHRNIYMNPKNKSGLNILEEPSFTSESDIPWKQKSRKSQTDWPAFRTKQPVPPGPSRFPPLRYLKACSKISPMEMFVHWSANIRFLHFHLQTHIKAQKEAMLSVVGEASLLFFIICYLQTTDVIATWTLDHRGPKFSSVITDTTSSIHSSQVCLVLIALLSG